MHWPAADDEVKIGVLGRVVALGGVVFIGAEHTSAVDGGSGPTGAVPWAPPDPQREGQGIA